MYEDPATRRVIDTQSHNWRLGRHSAARIVRDEPDTVMFQHMEANVMLDELVAEDGELRDTWGMYVILRSMTVVFEEYLEAS